MTRNLLELAANLEPHSRNVVIEFTPAVHGVDTPDPRFGQRTLISDAEPVLIALGRASRLVVSLDTLQCGYFGDDLAVQFEQVFYAKRRAEGISAGVVEFGEAGQAIGLEVDARVLEYAPGPRGARQGLRPVDPDPGAQVCNPCNPYILSIAQTHLRVRRAIASGPRRMVSGLYPLNCTPTTALRGFRLGACRAVVCVHPTRRATTSGSFATPPFGSRFPLPRGSRGRPPHTVSGGHPPVAPRGVGKACRWAAIACASPPAEETGKAIVWAQFS